MSIDHAKMAEMTSGLPSKSAKMRELARAGYSRSDIARFLGTRYQFVRNVLMHDTAKQLEAKSAHVPPNAQPLDGAVTRSREPPRTTGEPCRVRVEEGGRLTLPAAFVDALGLKPNDVFFAHLEDGEIHLLTPKAAMKRAQAIIRQFVPEGVSLVDELLDERRREAEREFSDG
jgi:bifunctional DNA-binding transcriptional regulator/antitoxin component of YhaV-PrlF toxin-antitoxin module